jgi:hypothetical protein
MPEDRSNRGLNDCASSPPYHQIRAVYTDTTITVYQAYSDEIADKALPAQKFVPPFQFNRMTWIKPSFLWMMYRSAWGTKDGQKRVLAIDITRSGFQWCLEHACLSHFDPAIHASDDAWQAAKEQSAVRVQWDPERSIRLARLDHRSIQIGLSGPAVEKYVGDWIVGIQDVTSLAHSVHGLVESGDESTAAKLLPREVHYPAIAPHLGLTA